ncbi:hypothetical protein N5T96_06795 [Aliarcobacter butzleri]|uniref:hypothetical protein n=1 Tax=Aliarcobacter butzleri TaxID=28197 RepID=UPI0021B47CD7|nr:hypothetical protein [Aliarcobacter butzleri]MCT7566045.1 hypothetical protein [Aliarcobacter butzleri]MCT7573395.1 hypothetical protein [Aliarcobacter butzleri]
MKKILTTFELEFKKNVGLKIDFNPAIDQSGSDRIRENRYLFAKDDLSQIKVLTLRSNGDYTIRDLSRKEAKEELERYYQSHLIRKWKFDDEKELKKTINKNEVKLLLIKQKIENYKNWAIQKIEKNPNLKNNDKEFALNPDFAKSKEKNKDESIENKAVFVSQKIEKAEAKTKELDTKINDFDKAKKPKEELFFKIEKEIKEFEAFIDELKEQNKALKKELELLIEKNQKKEQKENLERENTSLKEKIEKMREKQEQKNANESQKTEKINKVSYQKNAQYEQEREV